MARSIENVKDINDSKDMWKIAIRIRDLGYITRMSNKYHLEFVIIDARVFFLSNLIITTTKNT